MTKENLPKLTRQDEKFVEKVIETGNLTLATQESYGIEDPNYAGVKGHRLIRKDKIINAIEVKRKSLKQALLDKGINEDYLADKVNVLLNAIDDKGNEDYTAIDKGLKHATNIYGIEDPFEKGKVNNTYNFLFTKQVKDEVNQIESIIKSKLTQRNVQDNQESDETF